MSAVPQELGQTEGATTPWQRAAVALLLGWAWLLFLYRQTADAMLQIWLRSDTFAHGLLVLPLALWLVWRQRRVLARLEPVAAPGALVLVALAGLAWLLGELALVNALTQAALVALLVLAVPLLLGRAVAQCIAFPLAFLFFAVPVGEFLLPPLMDGTANVTVFALRASGIPVYRAGNSFVIPSGSWSVVEACSGVRYLIASCMLGTLFAYLSYRSWRKRLLFVLVALLLPVLANWLRAYLVVLLGHVSGNRLAAGVDHLLYGWLFFGLVMALMFWVGMRWAEPWEPLGPASSVLRQPHTHTQRPFWPSACALLLLSAVPQLALQALERQASTQAQDQAATHTPAKAQAPAAPALGPRWPLANAAAAALPLLQPAYQKPSQVWQAHYGASAPGVGLYIALYRQQGRGHRLVGSGNAVLASDNPHWTVVARGSHALRQAGQTITLGTSTLQGAKLLASAGPGSLQVWQLYWVNGHVTASAMLARAWGAWARLRGQSDDAAVLLAYAPDAATLAAFWADNYTPLMAWLAQQETP